MIENFWFGWDYLIFFKWNIKYSYLSFGKINFIIIIGNIEKKNFIEIENFYNVLNVIIIFLKEGKVVDCVFI